MSDIRDYLIRIDEDEREAMQIVQTVASKLVNREVSLLDVVQSLEKYINDEDQAFRAKAVTFLGQILGSLPKNFLTRQQVQVLTQFLCDRMEDGGAIIGLNFLSSSPRLNADGAIQIFRTSLEKFRDLQTRPQIQRFQVFTVLSNLLAGHREAIKGLGSDSLVGIMDLVSGEKDPRNLMIVFSVMQIVLGEWELAGYEEALFDSVFCYFPITFRPPPNDRYGITAQDLKIRLKDCIAASASFAPYAFPQLLEKLDSSSAIVKTDVLQAIAACASSYGAATVCNYSATVWDLVKYEIFNAQDEDLAKEALLTITAIASCLSRSCSASQSSPLLRDYMWQVLKDCNERLQEPQHKQAVPAADTIARLAETGRQSLRLVAESTLPILIRLYHDSDIIEKRKAIMSHLWKIMKSANIVIKASGSSEQGSENPMAPLLDSLFQLSSQALMRTSVEEESFRVLAAKCLSLACSLYGPFAAQEIGLAVQYFNEIAIVEGDAGRYELRVAVLQSLRDISQYMPAIILDITFPMLLARLPDTGLISKPCHQSLKSLAYISCERDLSDTLVRRLFAKLEGILENDDSTEYAETMLTTLHFVLSQRELETDAFTKSYAEKVIGLIIRSANAVLAERSNSSLVQVSTMVALGRLASLILRDTDDRQQLIVGENVYSLFGNEPLFVLPNLNFKHFPELRRRTIILSTYLLAAIRKEVPLPYSEDQLYDVLDSLVKISMREENESVQHHLLRHMALLVNKFMGLGNLERTRLILVERNVGLFDPSCLSRSGIRAGFWLAKALLLRLHSVEELLPRLLSLLSDVEHGSEAAKGFKILLAGDEIVSKENGATIRLLARQKTFSICLPIIAECIRNAHYAVKINYFIALSGLLKNIDSHLLRLDTKFLVPILLQSLDLDDQGVKAIMIDILLVIVRDSPSVIEEHISSLINRLLSAVKNSKVNQPIVRKNALKCLQSLPGKLNQSVLLIFRKPVSRGLLEVLDDPKRHVRKEAVTCIAAWLRLDEPDEDQ